jgi:hypothetical protein
MVERCIEIYTNFTFILPMATPDEKGKIVQGGEFYVFYDSPV